MCVSAKEEIIALRKTKSLTISNMFFSRFIGSFLLKLGQKKEVLRGFDPLLLFFMNEIKIVSYSFSSSVIEYNSNEKLLKA